jgi:hypothetical protein
MGHGGNMVLDKGFKVLSTYNSSAAAGVTIYRGVKFASGDTIDLNVAASTLGIGVVQERIDQADVATGKAVANVRMLGITKLYVQTAASIVQGSRLTLGNAGGAVIAATGNQQIGICLTTGTIAAGDLIDVLLTPGLIAP